MTDRNISDLCPELQAIYGQWLAKCTAAGLHVRAIVTWRDPADQDAAKAEGLSKAGAGQSPHGICDAKGNPCSYAFDFGCFTAGGTYITDGKDPRYSEAGAIGKQLGLVWGGDFHSIFDPDHLELPGWESLASGA